jgi:molecular chaperone DnaK
MGKEGSQEVNPDEAVALGAAIYAGLRSAPEKLKPMQREALKGVKVGDVANHFFGTIALGIDEHRDTLEDSVTIILKKDAPIPCSNTVRLFTASEGQRFINFRLTQSPVEELDPEFVNIVFEDRLGPLPPNRPAQQPLDITYRYDVDQVMWIEVSDVQSGTLLKTTYRVNDTASASISIPDFKID